MLYRFGLVVPSRPEARSTNIGGLRADLDEHPVLFQLRLWRGPDRSSEHTVQVHAHAPGRPRATLPQSTSQRLRFSTPPAVRLWAISVPTRRASKALSAHPGSESGTARAPLEHLAGEANRPRSPGPLVVADPRTSRVPRGSGAEARAVGRPVPAALHPQGVAAPRPQPCPAPASWGGEGPEARLCWPKGWGGGSARGAARDARPIFPDAPRRASEVEALLASPSVHIRGPGGSGGWSPPLRWRRGGPPCARPHSAAPAPMLARAACDAQLRHATCVGP